MNQYIQERYNRKKMRSRISLGVQILIQKPVINLLWVVLVALAVVYGEGKFMSIYESESFLREVMDVVLRIVNVVVTIAFILAIIESIGELTARKDEADMMLVFGNKRDVINQPPILIKQYRDKKRGTIQREFYTSISMEKWQENREAICDRLDEHLIGDFSYGGKRKNKGNHIFFETGKGRKVQERGTLYDEGF